MHGLDIVLVARDACTLRGDVDNIDEIGIVFLIDCGRKCKATNTNVAEMGTDDGGTDGTVSERGVSFDEDDGFHIVKSLRF